VPAARADLVRSARIRFHRTRNLTAGFRLCDALSDERPWQSERAGSANRIGESFMSRHFVRRAAGPRNATVVDIDDQNGLGANAPSNASSITTGVEDTVRVEPAELAAAALGATSPLASASPLWLMALAFAAGCAGGGSHDIPLNPGDTAAVLELGAPGPTSFTLHGTIPLPKHTFPRNDGLLPFVIVDQEGGVTSAQAEIVSRYPNDADGADVIEVSSEVARPSTSQPGDRLRYVVRYAPHPSPAYAGDPDVDDLLAQPASVVLRTSDCFGNSYSADLYADVNAPSGNLVRTLKDGAVEKQVVTHSTLMPDLPITGPQATLPHMMGAHAYFTRIANAPFFALDLRVHNGADGLDHQDPSDDPLGKIYFRSLELRLPQGWSLENAIDDPFFGAPYDEGGWRVWPIVQPLSGGKMHVMPAMSQFHRRLAVVKVGSETRALSHIKEESIAFVRPGTSPNGFQLFSWWNPSTARYFPQRQRLPALDFMGLPDLRAHDEGTLAGRLAQLASGSAGSWPAESPGLGWAQPWGTQDGGMVSGEEIVLYDGVTAACAASTAGYRLHQVMHRMYTDRQCNVLFDKNGLPTSLEEWIVHGPTGPTVPIWWYNEAMLWAQDPFGFNQAPTFQQDYVAASGLAPDYEVALAGYQPIDEAHLVRYVHDTLALVWLGNDAIAKDDLRMQAEGFRFAYHMYPQDQWGAIQPTGMLAARNYVDQHPGWGFAYGRGEAWGLDTMCAAYSTQDAAWRALTKPWFGLVADLVRDGQSTCSGVIQATGLNNVFNGQYRCRQSIEASITENALVGARESVFRDDDDAHTTEVNSILEKSIYAMIGPLVWVDAWHGPQAMIAVGPFDATLPPYCTWIPQDGSYGIPDHYQIWSSFAYAYAITGDHTFIDKATQATGGGDLLQNLMQNSLDPINTNIRNQVALLALMQSLQPNP
jgi:hypothetical protein